MIRNGIIIASLIFSAGIAGLWVWSYTGRYEDMHMDGLHPGWDVQVCESISANGYMGVGSFSVWYMWTGEFESPYSPYFKVEFGSFAVVIDDMGGRVRFSFWLPFLIFLAYPTLVFIRGPYRRWRRRRKGLCLACGYDLRGTDSATCSECGTPIEPVA